MTRKEEIEQAVQKNKFGIFHSQVAYEFGFQQGAEWADKTMIDKSCKWLYNNLYTTKYRKASVEEFIEDFRKAMEG